MTTPPGGPGRRAEDAEPAALAGPAETAVRLVAVLGGRGLTVGVAESLTGGAVVDAIVGVPGASRVLRGAVVPYATDLKARLLGVDGQLLARVGAVHREVATQMARGVSELLSADVGLATTGVAGPDHQDGHRPGTFHVAVRGPDGVVVVRSVEPGSADVVGSRAQTRTAARDAVLSLALEVLDDPGGTSV